MSKLDQVREILWLEAVASAALKAAGERRSALQVEAEAAYRTEGALKWGIPEVVQVILPLSKEAVVVTDSAKFQAWVQKRYPSEVETVQRVRPAFQENLFNRVVLPEGDVVVMPGDGEIIPGLGVRAGGTPKAVTLKTEPAAKAALAAHAQAGLNQLALGAGPSVPVVIAELEASDG